MTVRLLAIGLSLQALYPIGLSYMPHCRYYVIAADKLRVLQIRPSVTQKDAVYYSSCHTFSHQTSAVAQKADCCPFMIGLLVPIQLGSPYTSDKFL